MMEFYMAYADYNDLIDYTEDMFKTVALEVLGYTMIAYGKEGQEPLMLDFAKPFDRLTMKEAILKYAPWV